jgi:hypothetical protein
MMLDDYGIGTNPIYSDMTLLSIMNTIPDSRILTMDHLQDIRFSETHNGSSTRYHQQYMNQLYKHSIPTYSAI